MVYVHEEDHEGAIIKKIPYTDEDIDDMVAKSQALFQEYFPPAVHAQLLIVRQEGEDSYDYAQRFLQAVRETRKTTNVQYQVCQFIYLFACSRLLGNHFYHGWDAQSAMENVQHVISILSVQCSKNATIFFQTKNIPDFRTWATCL